MPTDPTGYISIPTELIRGLDWKRHCRVATTANIAIATALNAGDSIDGVTLAAGDRVLVKDQTTGSQNGIYVAGATPSRAFDMDQDLTAAVPAEEVLGAVILVLEGSTNAGTLWRCTNTSAPTIGSTAVAFAQVGSGAPTGADYLVGTSQAGLSAEIVVGTTPGGELGGTWGSPTVDATHSGSAHADFIAVSLLTTQDDIIVRDGSGPARLGKGSDGQVLTVDPTTHHLVWANPTSGFTNPMTTKGDLIVGDTGGTAIRKAVGTDGQFLKADSASTGGVKWDTASGSGTVTTVEEVDGSPTDSAVTKIVFPNGTLSITAHVATYTPAGGSAWPPLDQYSIDGTYGDLFNGGSLNGRWTRRNYTGGAETFGFTKAGTGLRIAPAGRTGGDGYFQTAPAGDWTFAMKYAPHQFGANCSNWGIAVVDTNGTGLVTELYTNPAAILLLQLTTYTTYGGAYVQPGISTSSPNVSLVANIGYLAEHPIWVYLRKSGTSYYINYSLDGEAWWIEGGPITWSGTVDRIGMIHGPLANATGNSGATNDVYWFNKIA